MRFARTLISSAILLFCLDVSGALADPSTTILEPVNGASIKSGYYLVTGTATDGVGSAVQKVEVSTDGGLTWSPATGTNSWSYSWIVAADGIYSIKSRATGNTGQAETPGAAVIVNVDNTAQVTP